MDRVIAVVVTYNRKELLNECLEAIAHQSRPVNDIVLIDNASTDGTDRMLKSAGYFSNQHFHYRKMKKNIGGAGGFCEGIRYAHKLSPSWVWVMDDDTIPEPDCLDNLLHASQILSENNISFLASAVYGMNQECMNVPVLDIRNKSNGYPDWYRHLGDGMVAIRNATFVSIMIRNDAISQCGLPCKDYFIWGDDSEYTLRLTTYYGKAYFVGDSVAIHKRKIAKSLDIKNETESSRIVMNRYHFRNNGINERFYSLNKHPVLRQIYNCLSSVQYLGTEKGLLKAFICIKGSLEGIIQYPKFESYIKSQIKENFNR